MRVLIFHGYLLAGTGSNVYNARLADALGRLGHEVHLFCQDRHPERQSFVGAAGDWDSGALRVRVLDGPHADGTRVRGSPRCTVYRPDLGGLLPVYVQDRYEGTAAKTFAQCSDAEVLAYIQANVDAVREVAELVRPDVALANHLVMGPVILARALDGRVPYALKVHGSALEYTVKPEPERFLPFAHEGLAQARTVLVGSHHTAVSLWEAIGDPGLQRRTHLGPPGVDVERFAPLRPREAEVRIRGLIERLREDPAASDDEQANAFARDERAVADALERLADGLPVAASPATAAQGAGGEGPLVAFVGKLIVNKGVDLLIAAWPLVVRSVPDARLAVIGFGAYREGLERLIARLADGDLEGVREIAHVGRALEAGEGAAEGAQTVGEGSRATGEGFQVTGEGSRATGEGSQATGEGSQATGEGSQATGESARECLSLTHLLAFLDSLSGDEAESYRLTARMTAERVLLTGRLDHDELADVLPACEALVVPSTFPEAFGMVAVEAAACGVLPISAGHSGLAEVSAVLAEEISSQAAAWLSFPVDDNAVRAIADRVIQWLRADATLKEQARTALVAVARERWSWEGVGRGVIAAASGEPSTRA
jgi:glycosyltransferase involved in cell wall biosynthesis